MDARLVMYEANVFLPLGTKVPSSGLDGRVVNRNAMGLHVDRNQRALAFQLVDLLQLLLLDHSLQHGKQHARQPDVLRAVGFSNPARHSVHMAERINKAAQQTGLFELAVIFALAEIFSAERIQRVVKLELVDQRRLPLHVMRQGSRLDALTAKPAKIVGRVTIDKRDVGLLSLRTQPSEHTLGINIAFSVPHGQVEVAAALRANADAGDEATIGPVPAAALSVGEPLILGLKIKGHKSIKLGQF